MYVHTKPYREVGPYNYLLNLDFPEVKALKEIITARYKVRLKYTPKYSSWLWLNGYRLIYRPGKFKPIVVEHCTIIEGTPLPQGGSNVHPYPTFEEGYYIVEAECDGFPDIDSTDNVELLSIVKL